MLLANQNRYANEVLDIRIRWRQTTWVVLAPITTHIPSFINVAHTELWIFDIFVISQSEQICKWGIKYAHTVTTDHMGCTCAPPHYPLTKKIGHCVLIRERRFTFWCWWDLTSIHPYIHIYRHHYNWKLSGPSSIAGGPQKAAYCIGFWNCQGPGDMRLNIWGGGAFALWITAIYCLWKCVCVYLIKLSFFISSYSSGLSNCSWHKTGI